jgi:hypothetical protein
MSRRLPVSFVIYHIFITVIPGQTIGPHVYCRTVPMMKIPCH